MKINQGDGARKIDSVFVGEILGASTIAKIIKWNTVCPGDEYSPANEYCIFCYDCMGINPGKKQTICKYVL